jgi:hypothetical protein
MEQESRGLTQGTTPPHVEPFRETEPLPDDTDDEATRRALLRDDAGKTDEADRDVGREGDGGSDDG